MSNASYAARFTEALAAALPDSFEVIDMGGDLVIARGPQPAGGSSPATISTFISTLGKDRRKPVDPIDVQRWIETAVGVLRRNMPHYTSEAQAAAHLLLDALNAESEA